MYENAIQGNINHQAAFGQTQTFKQSDYAQAVQMPNPGVVSMTEKMHQAFEVLSQSLGDLISKVGPLVEPYPEPGSGVGNTNPGGEAPAITGMRLLIERINDKTGEIQRLTAALRV